MGYESEYLLALPEAEHLESLTRIKKIKGLERWVI
jgi:hypothetical protein